MKYQCIIFDCDGVLVDSEKISNRVLLEMLNSLNVVVDDNYALENFSGTSLTSIFAHIEQKANKKLPVTFEQEYRKKTFELFKTELKPVEGIIEILERISIPVCVASSGPLEKIKLNLEITGIIKYFKENIFSSYEIGSWKPDPGIFEYAAKQMGFLPDNCLVVEDSIAGIKAAKKGGFDVCGYINTSNRKRFELEGAFVIHKMSNLLQIIENDLIL